MKQIDVVIEGTTPLLMNRFTDAAQLNATNGTASSTVGDKGTPQEQAEQSLYTDENKNPIMPGPNLFKCLMEGGRFFKMGRSKVTTQKSSLFPACVEIHEFVIPVSHKEPWSVDTRPVRIPATGGRILRHRAMFFDWKLSFSMGLDTDMMTAKLLRDIVDSAGKKIGLGDFRPDCKGPMGKFVVTKWKEKG